MQLVLSIDSDPRQIELLAKLVRGRLAVELIQVTSAGEALQALGDRVPDLIMTPPLLSPFDEGVLAEYLRELGPAATHVQTLRIPVIGAPKATSAGLSFFRRKKKVETSPDGCDPNFLADEIAVYLARAAEERAEAVSQAEHAARIEQLPTEEPASRAASVGRSGNLADLDEDVAPDARLGGGPPPTYVGYEQLQDHEAAAPVYEAAAPVYEAAPVVSETLSAVAVTEELPLVAMPEPVELASEPDPMPVVDMPPAVAHVPEPLQLVTEAEPEPAPAPPRLDGYTRGAPARERHDVINSLDSLTLADLQPQPRKLKRKALDEVSDPERQAMVPPVEPLPRVEEQIDTQGFVPLSREAALDPPIAEPALAAAASDAIAPVVYEPVIEQVMPVTVEEAAAAPTPTPLDLNPADQIVVAQAPEATREVSDTSPVHSVDMPVVNAETPVAHAEAPVMHAEAPVMHAEAPVAQGEVSLLQADAPLVHEEAAVVHEEAPVPHAEAPPQHEVPGHAAEAVAPPTLSEPTVDTLVAREAEPAPPAPVATVAAKEDKTPAPQPRRTATFEAALAAIRHAWGKPRRDTAPKAPANPSEPPAQPDATPPAPALPSLVEPVVQPEPALVSAHEEVSTPEVDLTPALRAIDEPTRVIPPPQPVVVSPAPDPDAYELNASPMLRDLDSDIAAAAPPRVMPSSLPPTEEELADRQAPPSNGEQKRKADKRKPSKKAKPARLVQDEWGLFDPDQCGFAAVVEKLNEVNEESEEKPKTTVRVISYR